MSGQQLASVIERAADYVDAARNESERAARIRDLNKRLNGEGQSEGKKKKEKTQGELLLEMVADVEVWHTSQGEEYATIGIDGHLENHPIRSTPFRKWWRNLYYRSQGRAPSSQAFQDALATLEAKAHCDGEEHIVHLRSAEHGGAVYYDLANPEWEAVEVSAEGWQVVQLPPVKFRRPKGMLSIPHPVAGGSLRDLQEILNLEENDFILAASCLVAYIPPTGPYPVQAIIAEYGAGKTFAERVQKSLIDPSVAPLRSPPKDERDLIVGASNTRLQAYDNLSHVQPWLSDALCRLATGAGYSTRQLYTDAEEMLFSGSRPIILNGITDVVRRNDLADRSVLISLSPIPETGRRTEAELWSKFEEAKPGLLGALFDAVSMGLRNLPTTELESPPRMADFATFVVAAEPAMPWESGAFLEAYAENRQTIVETALESDLVASAVMRLLKREERFSGTATELLEQLVELVPEKTASSRPWPKNARSLAERLRVVAPLLRRAGYKADFARGAKRIIRLSRGEPDDGVPEMTLPGLDEEWEL